MLHKMLRKVTSTCKISYWNVPISCMGASNSILCLSRSNVVPILANYSNQTLITEFIAIEICMTDEGGWVMAGYICNAKIDFYDHLVYYLGYIKSGSNTDNAVSYFHCL